VCFLYGGDVQVDLLHQCEREQVLPQLHALLEEGQAAHVFAQEQVMADLQQFWDMPAMHLRPKHLCEYKHTTAPGMDRTCIQQLLGDNHMRRCTDDTRLDAIDAQHPCVCLQS
jgi:hypothetical protein